MKCYALVTCIKSSEITWSIPKSTVNPGSFFANRFLNGVKHEIYSFLRRLSPNTCQGFKAESYYIYAHRAPSGFYGLACDTQLDQNQLVYLYNYLFVVSINPALIAEDLPQYTSDFKLKQIQAEVEETKERMKENIEKILARGDHMEDLLARTEVLNKQSSQLSFNFYRKNKALNNGLPNACILC